MSLAATVIDYTTLPGLLLPTGKAHCRVDFDRDDPLIVSMLARAIAHFERVTEISVFAATYLWTPASIEFTGCYGKTPGPRVPRTPVRSFTAAVGALDVTADYALVTLGGLEAVQIYYLTGTWQTGLGLTIETGYTNAASIPPGIVDLIMQITATNYENREMLVPSGQFIMPGWMTEQLAGWWMPKL